MVSATTLVQIKVKFYIETVVLSAIKNSVFFFLLTLPCVLTPADCTYDEQTFKFKIERNVYFFSTETQNVLTCGFQVFNTLISIIRF